jgi:hypothetical protein
LDPGVFVVLGLGFGACAYVSFRKGKPAFGALGLLGVIPGLTPLGLFAVVGAVRYAKPGSTWARDRYSPFEMEIAWSRFPGGSPHPPSVSEGPDAEGLAKGDPVGESPAAVLVIVGFLGRAAAAGLIDESTRDRLTEFARGPAPETSRGAAGPEPERPTAAPVTDFGSDVAPGGRARAAPADEETDGSRPFVDEEAATRVSLEPPGTVESKSPPPIPEGPLEPSRIALAWRSAWDSVTSDVALHGFAYLGVVLTFIGVLGFLLFAFADLPDAVQPFVELAIALVFFGWSWMLRRQNADRVAAGMELIGGMVVPLIVFAGMVDNAPIPPDFTDGALVAALTLVSMALAGLYAWISARNNDSTLRFLVAPLIWLAALSLGFVFKGDEPLASEAITRLVSPQPALASVAIALTLLACLYRPDHRLAAPTVRSALVGAPAAYLLTISLAFGEDFTLAWPIALAGAGTLVSFEVVARWFHRPHWTSVGRPVLLAAVLVPLVPAVGAGWIGLATVISYATLFELERRQGSDGTLGSGLALAGVAVGLVMTLVEPWAALAAFGVSWIWAHRRRLLEPGESLQRLFVVASVMLPIGIVFALDGVWGPETAWLVMSILVLIVGGYLRIRRVDDAFWTPWLLGAAVVVGLGAGASWLLQGTAGFATVWTLGLVAVSLAVGSRWPAARTWLTSLAASGTLAVLFDEIAWPVTTRRIVWAGVGLAAVVAANLWRRQPAGHLAAVGHLVTTLTLVSLVTGGDTALVVNAWAAGWVITAIGDELGGHTLSALLSRLGAPAEGRATAPGNGALWLVPVLVVVSVPIALTTAGNRWDEFAMHRSWTGILVATVGIVYALVGRSAEISRRLRLALGVGAVALAVVGVSVAAPDGWPTIYAASAVVVVAAVLSVDLRRTWFVWFAWAMTVLIALLIAREAGVSSESLHFVSLGWGAVLLVGGLVFDDVRSGRRRSGEGLRIDWVRYPVFLGALVMPMSLGPAFADGLEAASWWAIAAAVVYAGVAMLIRVGSVTAPAYALAALGVSGLWQQPMEEPWSFVVVATPLVAASWMAERWERGDRGAWLGWDKAPLIVAHGVAGVALLFAAANGGMAATAAAFGILSALIGWWKHTRVWIDAGHLLVLLAALDLGPGWLALALGATALRGVIGVGLTRGTSRVSYQVMATAGAGLGWLAYLDWSGLDPLDASGYSMVAFGVGAAVLSALGRWGLVRRDTNLWWIGLGVAGAATTAVMTLVPAGPGIEGAWFAAGLALLGAALEMAAREEDIGLGIAAVVSVGLSWFALLAGLQWGAPEVYDYTALVFGGVALVASLAGRLTRLGPGAAMRWMGLGIVLLVIATLTSGDGSGGVLFEGPEWGLGVLMAAAALEISWPFTGVAVRYVAIGGAGASWAALAVGMGWDADTVTVWTATAFGLLALAVAELGRRLDTSVPGTVRLGLLRAWGALSVAGVVAAVGLSYAAGVAESTGYWAMAGLGALTIAAARGAGGLRVDFLREASGGFGLASFLVYTDAAGWSTRWVTTGIILIAVAATGVALLTWRNRPDSVWARPALVTAGLANLTSAALAVTLLPEQGLLVGVMLSVGLQVTAVGLSRAMPWLLACGPPLLGAAFVLSVGQSVGGSAQWYTVPAGLVLLSEVEIYRSAGSARASADRRDVAIVMEWVGIGLLAAPPLVEMFTQSLFMGLGGLAVAVAVFLWGVATRVRRRVVAAAALAVATVVLLLFAAAAGSAPESAFFWIVAIGVGLTVMLVAGLVEAYRTKRGRTISRLDALMEGWE